MYFLLISMLSLNISGNNVVSQPIEMSSIYQPQTGKTLELRYSVHLDSEKEEVEINGETFKIFSDKQSAVDYYYFIKKEAPEKVIFYIASDDEKEREVYIFRAVE